MRKPSVIIAILLISLGLGLVYRVVRDAGGGMVSATQETRSPEQALVTKTDSQNDVEVQVTPKAIPEEKAIEFEIILTTHSVELSQDLVAVSSLVDQTARVYKPTSWEGSPPGGHHRSGVLRFEGIVDTTTVILMIDVGGERVFRW
ncbi:MAG: hypothetical protein Q7S60_04800 [bacterium]|nr:hypothetical protein [bacterium]